MPKGIRKAHVDLAASHPVVKSNELRTEDLAEPSHETSAIADMDHLVTATVLRPETEEVALSAADVEKAYLDELKFNEEIVTITIAESAEQFPIDPVEVGVNGRKIYIKRGVPTQIPRKYVEALCSPIVHVATKQTKNNLGEDATELTQRRSIQFPFSLHDTNPRGKEWLAKLLRR